MSQSTSARKTTGFSHFDLGRSLQRAIGDAGWTEPRPIQSETIPAILEGRDALGLAQTGTGKTAAFALPILELLLREPGPGPRALVVAPTRELAAQIHAEVTMLARHTRIQAITVFGGVSQGKQVRGLRKNPEIVVACPGRLLDLVEQGHARLDRVQYLVLDEADHMFDMGFLPDIRRILKKLPAKRQNLLFSATMPREIRQLADSVLRNPCVAELEHSKPAETVEHGLYAVLQGQKLPLLRKILGAEDFSSAIVFSRTKHRAKRLARQLSNSGHDAVALQGNMSQAQRQRAMRGFRSGRYDVLVATDIAARGIDVSSVSHVINFDIPNTPDAYTHRIGRTGRAERSGQALTFVGQDDVSSLHEIERKLGIKINRRELAGFESFAIPSSPAPKRRDSNKRRGSGHGSGRGKKRTRSRRRRRR